MPAQSHVDVAGVVQSPIVQDPHDQWGPVMFSLRDGRRGEWWVNHITSCLPRHHNFLSPVLDLPTPLTNKICSIKVLFVICSKKIYLLWKLGLHVIMRVC